jgi:hypothetical protein
VSCSFPNSALLITGVLQRSSTKLKSSSTLGTLHPLPKERAYASASVRLISFISPTQPLPFYHSSPKEQRFQINFDFVSMTSPSFAVKLLVLKEHFAIKLRVKIKKTMTCFFMDRPSF